MEVLTSAEMERADRLAIAAGTRLRADAERGPSRGRGRDAICGGGCRSWLSPVRGNNGGDGFVAAAELAARGREVSVMLCASATTCEGEAASAAKGWKYPVLPFNPQAIGKPALIIDALFGAGLSRPVTGEPRDDDRGNQRQRRSRCGSRPAQRHQRHHRQP